MKARKSLIELNWQQFDKTKFFVCFLHVGDMLFVYDSIRLQSITQLLSIEIIHRISLLVN